MGDFAACFSARFCNGAGEEAALLNDPGGGEAYIGSRRFEGSCREEEEGRNSTARPCLLYYECALVPSEGGADQETDGESTNGVADRATVSEFLTPLMHTQQRVRFALSRRRDQTR